MIIVYPMLVSKAVSENIVPGLTKTIEQFIIVNLKDTILSNPEVKKKLNLKLKNGRLMATESVNLAEAKDKDWGGRSKPTPAERVEAERQAELTVKAERKKIKAEEDRLVKAFNQYKEQAKKEEKLVSDAIDKYRKQQEDEKNERTAAKQAQLKKDYDKAEQERQAKEDDYTKAIAQQNQQLADIEKQKDAQIDDFIQKRRDAASDKRSADELQLKQDKFADDKKERERKRLEDEKKKAEEDEADKKKKAEEEAEKDARAGVSSINISDNKALSIEPSTIEVNYTDRNGYSKPYSLGVKVIPFRVKSEAKLSRLIMHDTNLKWFSATLISLGRKITRRVWGFVDRWAANLKLGGLIPSGDPRRDIVMSRSGYKGGGYIVLNKTYDIDESFLNNVKKINRLYKMGWGNIIIVDNVNRMAYFCLKEFKGVCTAISFAMIYHNFKALQVYDSLEDATRQSSSIFKIKKQFSKVVAEWIVDYKRAKYLSEDK